jgi:DNA polymerase I-like protein with 3'-5' exonuclease and polymerase domains
VTASAPFRLGPWTFDRVYPYDWEWLPVPGEHALHPLSVVVHELVSNRSWRYYGEALEALRGKCPFDVGHRALWVSTHGAGDLQCFLTLGWPLPVHVIDTFTEFRHETNGKFEDRARSAKAGQLDMARFYRVPAMSQKTKEAGRQHGKERPTTAHEWQQLLAYNAGDVRDLTNLFQAMLSQGAIHPARALLAGRYLKAVARIERRGVPIDIHTYDQIVAHHQEIVRRIIREIDKDYGIYDDETFKLERFGAYLARENIEWPRTATGRLSTSIDVFEDQAKLYPAQLRPLAELRQTIAQLRKNKLQDALGGDGRNRAPLWPFSAITGRNQPPGGQSIFLQSHWFRFLIKAPPGMALAYLDWGAQEIGIAARLSGDLELLRVYDSSDPYITFGQLAGKIPVGATKHTHPNLRSRFKALMLGVNYGMSEFGLARRLGIDVHEAQALLLAHSGAFPRFWRWIAWESSQARDQGTIMTRYGWTYRLQPFEKDTLLQNWPMQSHGSEMMRFAACFATERGIQVCGIVHDAFLIQAAANEIDHAVAAMREAMDAASRVVLDGFVLKTDVQIIRPGERYHDADGQRLWELVQKTLHDILVESGQPTRSVPPNGQAHCRTWRGGRELRVIQWPAEPLQRAVWCRSLPPTTSANQAANRGQPVRGTSDGSSTPSFLL